MPKRKNIEPTLDLITSESSQKKQKVEEIQEFQCNKCNKKVTECFYLNVEKQIVYCSECNIPFTTMFIKNAKTKFGKQYCTWCNYKTKFGSFCRKHKRNTDISNDKNFIKCTLCDNEALYAVKGESFPEHCLNHREINETNVYKVPCIVSYCMKTARHGPSDNKFVHCHKHKTQEDTFNNYLLCLKCSTVATFGYYNDKNKPIVLYCCKHKEPNHIVLLGKHKCSCGKFASFIAGTDSVKIFCSSCNPNKELKTNSRTCKYNLEPCSNLALYGDPRTRKKMFCEKHAGPQHEIIKRIYIKKPICLFCDKKALYGLKGKDAEYCQQHYSLMIITGKVKDYIKIC